ncbi:hypothetical protein D7X98_09600 [bacterium 1XD8-76]|nr:hypothetical protein D7X98_09600 [bacterium 1XD8-76]
MDRQIRTKNKIVILLVIEFLFILFMAWRLTGKGQEYVLEMVSIVRSEESGDMIDYVSQNIFLRGGSYRVVIDYETDSDMTNVVDVLSESAGYGALKANTTPLYAGQRQTSHLFWLTGSVSDLQVKVTFGGAGNLAVSGGKLVRTNHMERAWLLAVLVFLALFDTLLYVIWKWGKQEKEIRREKILTAVCLGGIILGSSLPLFTDYLLTGADMTGHLLRIEGVKDGVLMGQFPVRIHPNWLQGHGYASGIFYCDLFLYLPAFLRIMGFTVQTAYVCYKLFINILTCLIAWYSFKRMFHSNRIGIFGSFLYTFYMVRLVFLYAVDGVGQYTSMVFLPLIVYGFYRILVEDQKKAEERYSFIPLSLGLSGILCSHVLTCEIVLFFILLLCVVCIKKLFQREIFLQLCKAAVCTILLNCWYLVPFLDYMFSMDLAVTKGGAAYKQIQTWGMYLPQLFDPFPPGGRYGARSAGSGMVGETGYGIGLGLTLGLLMISFLLTVVRKPLQKTAEEEGRLRWLVGRAGKIVLAFGLLSMWMATIYFPWDRLAKSNALLRQFIATLQFPYRMLTATGIFLTVACCLAIKDLEVLKEAEKLRPIFVHIAVSVIAVGHLMTATYFYNATITESSGFFRLYDEASMGNSYISGGEYILVGTDTGKLTYKGPVCSERIVINSYEKKGSHVRLDCDCGEQGQYIELPLLYYKGYRAVESGGGKLQVVCGENNVVRVMIPSGFQGIIEVDFAGFWYWRAAELVSLLTACMLLLQIVRRFCRERNERGLKIPEE